MTTIEKKTTTSAATTEEKTAEMNKKDKRIPAVWERELTKSFKIQELLNRKWRLSWIPGTPVEMETLASTLKGWKAVVGLINLEKVSEIKGNISITRDIKTGDITAKYNNQELVITASGYIGRNGMYDSIEQILAMSEMLCKAFAADLFDIHYWDYNAGKYPAYVGPVE